MRHALALLAVLALGRGAGARGRDDEARRLFSEGVALLGKDQYQAAIDKFSAAYALSPNPKILLNLGTAQLKLGRDIEAADSYRRYLRAANPDEKRRAEVEKVLDEIGGRTGRIAVEVNEPGAQVYVDGAGVGQSPLPDPVLVASGAHRVEATKQGFRAASAQIDAVLPGEGRAVRLVLEPEGGVVAAAPVPSPPATAPPSGSEPPPASASDALAPPPASLAAEPPPPLDDGSLSRGSFGARAMVDGEVLTRGVGGRVGLLGAVNRHIEAGAYALIGGAQGFGLSASLAPWPAWRVRPSLDGALDVFFVDGARGGARGGLGVDVALTRRFSVAADAGVQHFPLMPEGYETTFFVLGLGVAARL